MSVGLRAHASSRGGDRDLEDRFPGRWDTKRAFHDDLRPLIQAVADATAAAGWWSAGTTLESVGLAVGVDLHGWGHAERFTQGLRVGEGGRLPPLRPSTFLYSLPSTPASTLGLLFGFGTYQATVNRLGLSGFGALAHALDLLETARCERMVVAALTAVDPALAARLPAPFVASDAPFRLAVAWCLERGGAGALVHGCSLGPQVGAGPDTSALLPDVPRSYRVFAAPSLLAASRALGRGRRQMIHRDPCFEEAGILDVEG